MRAVATGRGFFQIAKAAAKDFSEDQCGVRAAALSYYTVFALPPLLILLIRLAGLIWNPDSVQGALETQFGGLVGAGGASEVRQMVESGQQTGHGVIATVLGIGGLLLGATGAFLSLQAALNAVWEVKPDPKQGGVKRFITKRLLSFGMLMGLAFLLVVSLAVTAAISALGAALGGVGVVMQMVELLVSTAFLAVLFAAMFKFLPDAVVLWRSVWVGGIATAVLFEAGKFAIGLYLGHSRPGNAFGAASALAVILVWIYYAGMLVLFGAEFTQHYAQSRGHAIAPKEGAVRIDRREQIVRPETSDTKPGEGRASIADGWDDVPPSKGAAARGESPMRENRSYSRIDTTHLLPRADGNGRARQEIRDASIGELFKRLSTDTSRLVQQEIQLAKAELQESAATAAKAGGKIGAAAMLALPGTMCLTAALVIGLGIIINSYWVSALLVGAVILIVAGVLAKKGMADFKSGLAPKETARSVREDVDWAKSETSRVKQELSA
ncbi:MAG: YhjD/YihY/BrkB family envelope integrity protein [Gemmatimonadaceae bacterium]